MFYPQTSYWLKWLLKSAQKDEQRRTLSSSQVRYSSPELKGGSGNASPKLRGKAWDDELPCPVVDSDLKAVRQGSISKVLFPSPMSSSKKVGSNTSLHSSTGELPDRRTLRPVNSPRDGGPASAWMESPSSSRVSREIPQVPEMRASHADNAGSMERSIFESIWSAEDDQSRLSTSGVAVGGMFGAAALPTQHAIQRKRTQSMSGLGSSGGGSMPMLPEKPKARLRKTTLSAVSTTVSMHEMVNRVVTVHDEVSKSGPRSASQLITTDQSSVSTQVKSNPFAGESPRPSPPAISPSLMARYNPSAVQSMMKEWLGRRSSRQRLSPCVGQKSGEQASPHANVYDSSAKAPYEVEVEEYADEEEKEEFNRFEYTESDTHFDKLLKKEGTYEKWYEVSGNYWQSIDPTDADVMGGWPAEVKPDIDNSHYLIKKYFSTLLETAHSEGRRLSAMDVGAGVGRVTRAVLQHYFHEIDLVEPASNLINQASKIIGELMETYKQEGLQPGDPGRLTGDTFKFLNVPIQSLELSKQKSDSSINRDAKGYRRLLTAGGIKVVAEEVYNAVDQELLPDRIYVTQPASWFESPAVGHVVALLPAGPVSAGAAAPAAADHGFPGVTYEYESERLIFDSLPTFETASLQSTSFPFISIKSAMVARLSPPLKVAWAPMVLLLLTFADVHALVNPLSRDLRDTNVDMPYFREDRESPPRFTRCPPAPEVRRDVFG
eukprot:gene24186-9780_t